MPRNRFLINISSLFVPLLLTSFNAFAQDSTLLKTLDDAISKNIRKEYVQATFKATQVINTPTIEAPPRGGLQFMIMHRFGKLNEGAYALFGLDNAGIRFGLDYGINDRLSIGLGRSSFDKVYDGYFKLKMLRQAKSKSPVSISLYESMNHVTLRYSDKPYISGRYRSSYQSALLIARKFSPRLSLQLTPSWLHYNLVPTPEDNNDAFALGMAGRIKLTKRTSLNAEYNYFPSDQTPGLPIYHSLSFGIDLETGGHVFQLVFTNSQGMVGPYYLGKTTGSWANGDIYFGFNVSRAFNLKKDR
ncbi:MAG TPA: DUF5777 family beta-barrel protein [Chitinophagaceae bacterium]|nr:DUF5777 family beta-barrel protein [Chitinophagaceae bacterium]